MDSYLLLKLLHIMAAVVVMGTGAGIAFFMFMAHRSKNPQAIMVTTQHVVLADWIFTTPAVITQLVTGLLLTHYAGFGFQAPWFLTVIGLFIFIGICWLPVLRIQYRLRDLARETTGSGELPEEFHHYMRRWTLLGIPAFAAILLILWLMVLKPLPIV